MNKLINDCMTPLDTLLMNYAAGRLEEPEELLVNAARALNPDVRSRIAQFEAMGARMMCEEAPAAVSAECLSIVMRKIDTTPAVKACGGEKKPCHKPDAAELNIPDIVHALISSVCADRQNWSRMGMGKGAMRMELRVKASVTRTVVQKRLRLMKLAPGQAAPRHAHMGTEITLVLNGAFTDELGTFNKGDVIIITDPHFVHQPAAGKEGCVCLSLTEARLRFHDPLARIMNTFWRI